MNVNINNYNLSNYYTCSFVQTATRFHNTLKAADVLCSLAIIPPQIFACTATTREPPPAHLNKGNVRHRSFYWIVSFIHLSIRLANVLISGFDARQGSNLSDISLPLQDFLGFQVDEDSLLQFCLAAGSAQLLSSKSLKALTVVHSYVSQLLLWVSLDMHCKASFHAGEFTVCCVLIIIIIMSIIFVSLPCYALLALSYEIWRPQVLWQGRSEMQWTPSTSIGTLVGHSVAQNIMLISISKIIN